MKKTYKQFRQFLNEKCFDIEKYKSGKYDKMIYQFLIEQK